MQVLDDMALTIECAGIFFDFGELVGIPAIAGEIKVSRQPGIKQFVGLYLFNKLQEVVDCGDFERSYRLGVIATAGFGFVVMAFAGESDAGEVAVILGIIDVAGINEEVEQTCASGRVYKMTPGLVVIPVCVRHIVFVRHACRHLVVGHKGHGIARHCVVGVLYDVGALTLALFDQRILGTGDPGVFRHVDAIFGQGQQVFLPDAVLVPAGVPVAEVLGIVGRVVVVKLMQVEYASGIYKLIVGIVGAQVGVQMETVGKV